MKSLHKKIRSLPVSEHQIRMTTSGGRHRKANRLVNEKSPYLLQHAYNPVDWYPWGEEAFQKARKESKLIFLSVGYSTCHWCHVMEKESFENDDIAKELNKHFVSIKVDREERPDVDKVYMSFIQATSGRGGWPMSVWLTPSLKPYTGGTYFPPSDTAWRKGFKTILGMVTHKWKQDKAACNASANRIMNLIKKSSENLTDPHQTNPTLTSCDKCARQLVKSFDAEHGGFGGAPKFPQPVNMNFLLRYSTCNPDTDLGRQSLGAVKHTLEMMANGGIHDHIGFGFHRYSTDERWHVPHFEKMLYDQGQLACAYADCYALTKEDKFRRSLRSILEYVERDLTHPDGGFYSAEDADSLSTKHDSEKKEGAFYAWTSDEIDEVLGADMIQPAISLADIFKYFYSVRRSGNVSFEQDPHGDLRGKNVLMSSPSAVEQCTDKFGVGADALVDAIETARGKLFRARDRRPRPHLDNKMITAWNGLMISGFAKASTVLGSRHYKQVATSAANFVRNHLYDSRSGFLLRSCYCDQDDLSLQQVLRPIAGYDSDYAFFIRSLIDLFEATSDADWLEWANDLQERQLELFWDEANGAFFSTTLHDPSILLRMKDDQDGAEPASNSVSSHNLLRLAAYLDRSDFRTKAEQLVRCFSDRLRQMPHALPEMAASVLWMSHGHKQIIIKGDPEDSEMKKMIKFINSNFIPNKVVIPANVERSPFLYRHLEDRLRAMDGGRLGVYVCEDLACRLPAANLRELKRSLRFTRASSSGGDESNITPWS